MGKTRNKELATKVSERVKELLDETGLKLEGLAVLCDIGKSAIKSYFSRTIPISLENVDKICSPFSLELSVFLNFKIPLPADLKEQSKFKDFHNHNVNINPDYFVIVQDPNHIPKYVKNDKERLEYIINETNYFYKERLTQEMVEDFKELYDVEFESGRLSQLLKSYLNVLIKSPAVKLNKDGSLSKKEAFKYVKKMD